MPDSDSFKQKKRYSPQNRKAVTFWLRSDLKERVDQFCKEHNISMTQFLHLATERALDMGLYRPVVPGERARPLSGVSDELQRKIQLRDELMQLETRGERLLEALDQLDLTNLELITTRIEVLKQEIKNELVDETAKTLETNIRNSLRRQLLKEIDEYWVDLQKEFKEGIAEELRYSIMNEVEKRLERFHETMSQLIYQEISQLRAER